MKLQVDLQGGRRLASLLQDLVHPAGHGLLAGVEALLLDRELPELGEELLQLFMDELELRSRGGRLLVDRLGQLLPVAKRQRGAGSGMGISPGGDLTARPGRTDWHVFSQPRSAARRIAAG